MKSVSLAHRDRRRNLKLVIVRSDRFSTLRTIRLVPARAGSVRQKPATPERARAPLANLQSDQVAAALPSREEGAGTITRTDRSFFLRDGRRHAGRVQS